VSVSAPLFPPRRGAFDGRSDSVSDSGRASGAGAGGGRGPALGSTELDALYSDVALIHRGK
jgi:hypothetical protein